MKSPLACFAFLLAGCATAASSAPPLPQDAAPPPIIAASPPPPHTLALLNAAGRGARAPTQADVERVFGPPDIARREARGAALTYRLETCALLLLFEADAQNAPRLASAQVSHRNAGMPPPSLERCASEAATRR